MDTKDDTEITVVGRLTGPRYCPRCKRGGFGDKNLCDRCGEGLVAQGYCPVCETTWRLPAGATCPKHEVELEPEAPNLKPLGDEEIGPPVNWITVASIGDDTQAEALRLRLEAEGIPTFVEGSRMGNRSMFTVATGGVRLQVPEPLLADARVLLSQICPIPPNADDLEDAWDEMRPAPWLVRRKVMKGLIVLMYLVPFLLVFLVASITRFFGWVGSWLSTGLVGEPEGAEIAEDPVGVGTLGDLRERVAVEPLGVEKREELAPGVLFVEEVAEVDFPNLARDQGKILPD